MVEDLVQWLRAQLDDDERTARATAWDGSGNKLDWELIASATIDVGGDEFYVGDRTTANHMMAWEPARVLREVEAKRQLVERYERAMENRRAHPDDLASAGALLALHGAVKLLALPYADRPGYREEWRP